LHYVVKLSSESGDGPVQLVNAGHYFLHLNHLLEAKNERL